MYVHVLLSFFFLARTNIYIYCNPVTYVKKNGQYLDRQINRSTRSTINTILKFLGIKRDGLTYTEWTILRNVLMDC